MTTDGGQDAGLAKDGDIVNEGESTGQRPGTAGTPALKSKI